jgi:CubicO group peptidase (beta-lactamase class C family)
MLTTALITVLLAVPQPPAAGPGARLDRWLTESGYQGSVLVVEDGKVLLRKGYGLADREAGTPYTPETVFTVGSITKQFTAAAILKLEMQGKLRVEDPISKYLPGVPEDKKTITVHHLLTHTSGLDSDFAGDYDAVGRDEYVKRALASKLRSAPGSTHFYANSGYSLLGAIVEIASGAPYETYLRENLFLPAGMKETGYSMAPRGPSREAVGYRDGKRWGRLSERPWADDGPYWALRANGGILSTVDDMDRWRRALEGTTVLSEVAKTKMFTPHVAEGPGGESFYGYGWAISKSPWGSPEIGHNGGNMIFSADFRRFPADRLVVITSSNDASIKAWRAAGALARIAHGENVPVAAPATRTLTPLGAEGRHAVARAWIDAFNSEGPEAMSAFRAAHVAPRPGGPSDEERARNLARMRDDLGRLEPLGVVEEGDESVTVRVKSARGEPATLGFVFVPSGKLDGVRVEIGD